MPWFVLFCFLTTPILFGVAATIATPALNNPKYGFVVYLFAALWAFCAYEIMQKLKEKSSKVWQGKWFLFLVVIPLVFPFLLILLNDPEITSTAKKHLESNAKVRPEYMAATAPANHTMTLGQTCDFVARVLPRFARYAIQLVTSLPPLWWLIAFIVSVWKGK